MNVPNDLKVVNKEKLHSSQALCLDNFIYLISILNGLGKAKII